MTTAQPSRPPARTSPDASPPLLAMRGLEKHYGGAFALRGASLEISKPGVVHTLVGQNGSGKSTLLGILAGRVRPDGGEIAIEGCRHVFHSPAQAVRTGIVMVSQETAVAPDLSVAENVLLGRRQVRGPLGISARKTTARARQIFEGLGLDYNPQAMVGELRPDQQQMIEIARAISMEARILILDEPTSSLTDDQTERLFQAVGKLTENGVAVVLVSHRLRDLFAIADEATVLRDGRTVCQASMTEMDSARLVREMTGDADTLPDKKPGRRRSRSGTDIALNVENLSLDGAFSDLNFQVQAGEIVGLAGLAGSGRSAVLEALFGVRGGTGRVELYGRPFTPRNPRGCIKAGLGYLPPDRKTMALNLEMNTIDNLIAIYSLPFHRLARRRKRQESEIAAQAAAAMSVRASSLTAKTGALSGGNQQKVALGRWLLAQPKLLLLDEPTRGVDVAAKWEIQSRLRELADGGLALLVSSSENDELSELCDRILVLFRGSLVGSLEADEATDSEIARLTGGHV